MVDNLKLMFQLLYRPGEAMSAILDRGSLLWASLGVLAVSAALQQGLGRIIPFPIYMPLLVLALAFVPGILVLCTVLGRLGGFAVSFQRDYSPLLTCAGLAWSAATLPAAVAVWFAPPAVVPAVLGAGALVFLVFMFFAVRTVLGAGNGASAAVVGLSWLPPLGAMLVMGPLLSTLHWLASPFFLFYAWYYLGGEVSNLGAGMRSRQNFRRMLDASAINPHDAEAQYQLGLIYQQRRNYTEAIQRFQNAVNIDNRETDAHYQLARIAREQGRTKDALRELEIVLQQDPKHSLHEVLREAGGALLDSGKVKDAAAYLEAYIESRPYDPQGLYYYGQALEGLGDAAKAREMYTRAVEADRTAPRYRRNLTARWSRLAQKKL